MALVKVTAYKYITIIDPFPMEGVGHVTLQQAPGTYKAYRMYNHQADRLLSDLDKSQTAGFLSYEIEYDEEADINTKRYASFSFNDVSPGTNILLGIVPQGVAVEEVALVINEAFDGGVEISIGDSVAQARLMTKHQNNPAVTFDYKRDVDYRYTVETEIYVYFITGNPTQGSAEVFVYLA